MPESTQAPSFNTIKEVNDMLTLTETLQRLRSLSRSKLQNLHLDPFYEKMLAILRQKISDVTNPYPDYDFGLSIHGVRLASKVARRYLKQFTS
jgi:hypothetical protein